jgi:two-component system sensor histidine kinase YesM
MDPAAAGWPLRKLIVQPFVENAVIHGFQELRRGSCLRLEMRLFRGKYLRVVIADNGAGMPQSTLSELRKLFDSKEMPSQVGGIGLENAYARICTYYHGSARVIIRSWPGEGTRVVLLLPHLCE